MNGLLFAAAVVMVAAGHMFRTKRWKSFISVYEDTSDALLLRAMSLGYMTDLLLPFHIGDVIRAAVTGKKLTNKTAFALATIIVDRLMDVFIVALFYLFFYISGTFGQPRELIIYGIGAVVLVLLAVWATTFSKPLKKAVLLVSSVFNEKIQLWLLGFVWSCICTFRNILHRINKPVLLLRTACMWVCYILSYYLLGAASGNDAITVFNAMFASPSSTIVSFIGSIGTENSFPAILLAYNALTSLLLFAMAAVIGKLFSKTSEREPELIIPYTSPNSRLDFLCVYFSDIRDKSYINSFLAINKDVTIVRNCSAGSNATTLMCIKNGDMLFRKYAFGADGEKLYGQVEWLRSNSKDLYVTDICNVEKQEQFCWYDMPYLSASIGFFDYIHSAPAELSWEILMNVIGDLERNYSSHVSSRADADTIGKYVDSKVTANLKKITSAPQIKNLMAYDTIFVNGREIKNLPVFMDSFLSADFWKEIFGNDYYSDIHGDLTIENIIYNGNYPKKYYLIDPNGGNIHNSPDLDYAKLLQSLHGGYEFLMHTDKVNVTDNKISFRMTRSAAYDALYMNMRGYMFGHFGRDRVKSIYFHEIIHWFRLMPYKINHDGSRAAMFYAGMMLVINDVFEEFIENERYSEDKTCDVRS